MELVQVLSWIYSLLRLFQPHPYLSVGFKLGLSKPNLVLGPQVPMCPHRELVATLPLEAAGEWFGMCVGSCPISLSLIFGALWLQNKGGVLGLGRMLKLRDERGKGSALESGVWLEGKELDKRVKCCLRLAWQPFIILHSSASLPGPFDTCFLM